ncbi:hypothetical protein D3C81_1309220 [compost metagenome]
MNMRCVVSAVVLLLSTNLAIAEEKPASTPFKYLDMPLKEAAQRAGVQPNQANNIVFDSEGRHVYLEASGGTVGYADVEFRGSAPCNPKQEIDSAAALQSLGMNAADLELAIQKPDNHTYYDHKRGLKVNVACSYEGAPLTVGFSRKQYNVLMGSTNH